MAELFTSFARDAVGDSPAGWSARWAGISLQVMEEGAQRFLRLSGADTGPQAASWDEAGALAAAGGTQEMLLRWRSPGGSSRQPHPVLFGSGGQGSESGTGGRSVTGKGSHPGGCHDGRSLVGPATEDEGFPYAAGQWWLTRLRVEGGTVRSRSWRDGAEEPTAWSITYDASAADTSGGWLGVLKVDAGSALDIAWCGVAVGGGRAPSSPVLPVTAFEARGRTGDWTSTDEAELFIQQLLAAEPGVEREKVGTSANGADLHMLRFGTGQRRLLFVAQQHGQELAGREAMFTWMRQWAQHLDDLDEVAILAMPTMQPDNLTERNNADDANINREHVRLGAPEALAIQEVITRYQPEVVIDLHEARNSINDVATHSVLNPNASAAIATLSEDLEQAVKAAVEAEGNTWEPYQEHNVTGPEYLQNAAGIRHAVGLLMETRRVEGDETDSGDRYQRQIIAVRAILEWHARNSNDVLRAAAASRAAAAGIGSVELVVGVNPDGPVIDPAPDGYLLTPADEKILAAAAQTFELPVTDSPEGPRLGAQAPSRVLAHYLADEESEQALVQAERCQPDPSRGARIMD